MIRKYREYVDEVLLDWAKKYTQSSFVCISNVIAREKKKLSNAILVYQISLELCFTVLRSYVDYHFESFIVFLLRFVRSIYFEQTLRRDRLLIKIVYRWLISSNINIHLDFMLWIVQMMNDIFNPKCLLFNNVAPTCNVPSECRNE